MLPQMQTAQQHFYPQIFPKKRTEPLNGVSCFQPNSKRTAPKKDCNAQQNPKFPIA